MSEPMRISPKYTVEDWKTIDFSIEVLKEIEIVKEVVAAALACRITPHLNPTPQRGRKSPKHKAKL